MAAKILIIDHKDSFTYNLVQLLEEAGAGSVVVRQVQSLLLPEIDAYDGMILSPGPGLPADNPLIFDVIDTYAPFKPVLGVCLGLQAIVQCYGGKLYNLPVVQHGRQVVIYKKDDCLLFDHISFPAKAGLYHSWAMDINKTVDCLEVTSVAADGTVMSLQHKRYNVHGIQFHPESYMTECGLQLMKNWLAIVDQAK